MWGSRDLLLEFLNPFYTSRMVEARNFKFGTETDGVSSNAKKCKIRSKGVMWGSRDPLLEFWHSLLYGEKPPVMGMLPNFACGFPSPTYSFVPDFIFIAPIVFEGRTPKNWLFSLT